MEFDNNKKKKEGGNMKLVKYNDPIISRWYDDFDNYVSPFNDMVRSFFGKDSSSGMVNVHETDDSYNLEFVLPGYKKEDINIEFNDDILTVKANRKENKEDKSKNYIRKEFVSTSFSRSFTLPEDVTDEMDAQMIDGILNLSVKKRAKIEKKSRTIEIK